MRWLIVLALVVPAFATNYTVKAGGGGNFTTISACMTQMSSNGTGVSDTCTVFAGTYTENVTVPAGSVGNYKIVNVNGSDIVTVNGEFTINSHTKVIGNCPFNTAIGNCGFSIQNTSSPGTLCVNGTTNMTDYFVSHVSMYACGGIVTGANGSNSNNGYFGYITFAYSCSTSGAPNVCTAGQIRGDNILLEYIATSHVSDGFYFAGAHITYRDSLFGPTVDTDCGSNSGNCHIDFMQADANQVGGARPVQYLLLERNTIQNMTVTGTGDAHAIGLFQAESCGGLCFNGIVRYTVANNVAHGGIIDDNSGNNPPPAAWDNVSAYNNTFYDVDHADASTNGSGTDGYTHGSTGAMSVNNIYYYPQNSMPGFNPYYCDGGGTTTCSSMTYGNNLAFCSSCGSTTHSSVPVSMSGANATFTGSFTFSAGTQFWVSNCSVAAYNGLPWTTASGGSGANIVATSPGVSGLSSATGCTMISYGGTMFFHTYGGSTLFAGDPGNLVVDPQFVTNGSNFNLQSGSPARSAGRPLSTANGSGSASTALIVHNANPFQDGGGTAGVQGDCIKVTSWANPCVSITAVNYSTNTLTLASPITWTNGDSVWLAALSDGTNVATDTAGPDMGAFPFTPLANVGSPSADGFSNTELCGWPAYACSFSNVSSVVNPTGSPAFTGINGAPGYNSLPEPSNPGFDNTPLIRVTDWTFATTNIANSGKAMGPNCSGNGFDIMWDVASNWMMSCDSGNNVYLWQVNPALSPPTFSFIQKLTTNNGQPNFSTVTPAKYYYMDQTTLTQVDSSLATSPGTATPFFNFATVCPSWDATRGARKTDPPLPNYGDTQFATGFEPSAGTQDTGRIVAIYQPVANKCWWINTSTMQIFGPSGLIGSYSPSHGTFKIHQVAQSRGSNVNVSVVGTNDAFSFTGLTGCAPTCTITYSPLADATQLIAGESVTITGVSGCNATVTLATANSTTATWSNSCSITGTAGTATVNNDNGTDPFAYIPGGIDFIPNCGGAAHCSGHWVGGHDGFITDYNQSQMVYKSASSPGTINFTFPAGTDPCASHQSSWDMHPNIIPFYADNGLFVEFGSTSGTTAPDYTKPCTAEIMGYLLSSNNPPTVKRFAHCNSGLTWHFNTDECVVAFDQIGRFFSFSSNMNNSLGDNLGNNTCTAGTVGLGPINGTGGNCRPDLFIGDRLNQ